MFKNIKIQISIALLGFSMKNAFKWVQTSLVLAQWFLKDFKIILSKFQFSYTKPLQWVVSNKTLNGMIIQLKVTALWCGNVLLIWTERGLMGFTLCIMCSYGFALQSLRIIHVILYQTWNVHFKNFVTFKLAIYPCHKPLFT